jgi:acyl-CoA synthetase (AMP-forming)/AMP-acid ligase II/acyl carrier protein
MMGLEALFGIPVLEAYGMTEAAHQMASNPLPPRTRKPGSVGLPAGVELMIRDSAGGPVGLGVRGEVVIRGPGVTLGYERNPEANAAAFTPDGWFRTGDQGYRDAEGYLFLTGRLKELINRGGEKIAPREVDEALMDHPAVAQAVTFAVPHPTLGEDVAAAVVLRPGAPAPTEAELRGFTAARLAYFKVPCEVRFVADIPKGPTGKIQRIGLAAALGMTGWTAGLEQEPAGIDAGPRNAVEERVAAAFADVLGLATARLAPDAHFFRLGGDSLRATQLVSRLRDGIGGGAAVSLTDVFAAPTVAELAERLGQASEVNTTE